MGESELDCRFPQRESSGVLCLIAALSGVSATLECDSLTLPVRCQSRPESDQVGAGKDRPVTCETDIDSRFPGATSDVIPDCTAELRR